MIGHVKAKDTIHMVNPKKGYLVTANNRVMPDNVKSDFGTTTTSTARAIRITEMIE